MPTRPDSSSPGRPPKLLGFLARCTTGTAIARPALTCSAWCPRCREYHGYGAGWGELDDPLSAELTFPSPCGPGTVAVGVDPGRREDSLTAIRLHHDDVARWRRGRPTVECRPVVPEPGAMKKARTPRRPTPPKGMARAAPPDAGTPVALVHGRLAAWRSDGRPTLEVRARCPACMGEVHRYAWPEGHPLEGAIAARAACASGPWAGAAVSVAIDPDRLGEARRVLDEHVAKLRSHGVEQAMARPLSPATTPGG
jgi:hypothetical protein